jgi:hypothetical protein
VARLSEVSDPHLSGGARKHVLGPDVSAVGGNDVLAMVHASGVLLHDVLVDTLRLVDRMRVPNRLLPRPRGLISLKEASYNSAGFNGHSLIP